MPIDVACTAVLFDCDGVLVDSVDSGERAWTRWAREYGLDPAVVLPGIHGRRSMEAGKPAPDGYLLAAHKLGRPIEHCVVFEDSVAGVAAGIAAGPHCVVGVGEQALDGPADLVVRNLSGTSRTGHGLRFAEASILRSPGRDLGQCTVVL